ncbi:phasin family protein [Sphingomonas sp. NBWT7]|uniref:phasin family protein n=1 Tax=Sphingomonas sp. NBWT7 TaxID=2596913 RepID=UPI00162A9590|nr:phasin family protein [Sphingomonas sp. NBWT7]QNE31392.1 phasin family protein [Sphingomonas sp. NBWT7]
MADEKNTETAGAQGTTTDAGGADAAADRMKAGAQKARETFEEKVADPARRAGAAMKASGEKVAEGNKTIGLAMIDQAEQNAREAFAAMRAAAGANDLSQVMKIQGDYLREQNQRNMTQAREIGELIMRFGREAVAPLRGASER